MTSVQNCLRFAIIVMVCGISNSNGAESPTVKTPTGTLKGKYLTSRDGRNYEAFLGIRYATIPSRFENSIPAPIWDGTREATAYGPICPQPSLATGGVVGEEDCLVLNVYTPKADDKKRPVIMFIHGGCFFGGNGDMYGGKYFMDEEVVLVTINYRLGILGFLNTRDGLVTGNMGLRDQVMALKWVHQNIEAFGGDSARVTVSGESAGAVSVLHLVLSPLTKGMIFGAICESGSATNPWAYRNSSLANAVSVGQKLECASTDSSTGLVDCLKEKSVVQLIGAQSSLAKWYIDPVAAFPPSMEIKNERNPEPFISRHPLEALKARDFPRIPILMTVNKDEGLMLHGAVVLRNEQLLKELNSDWGRVAPITFYYESDPGLATRQEEVSKKLRKYYFGEGDITLAKQENMTNLYTDSLFLRGIHKTALQLAKHTSVYTGLITHARNDFSAIRIFGVNQVLGVSHADELSYLYNPAPDSSRPLAIISEPSAQEDVAFSKGFVKIQASFARTGVPEVTLGRSSKWAPVSKAEVESGELNWLNLGADPFVHLSPFKERMGFWEELYK